MNKRIFLRILSITLVLSVCITQLACASIRDAVGEIVSPHVNQEKTGNTGESGSTEPGNAESPPSDDEVRFDLWMDELFIEWVAADTISVNFYVADHDAMGIEYPEATYGTVSSLEQLHEEREETEKITELLSSFDYDMLREDQKLLFDIMSRSIEIARILESDDDFMYYRGNIRPLNGIQAQLPILLAEFKFYTVEDIGRYLELLADTIRYFDDLIEFERVRAEKGYFLNDANTDEVIEQIESYIKNREDNLLITVFNDKIDGYEGLTTEQREQFKQDNQRLVLENVLVAYDNLLEAMKDLRGVGGNPGGLAALRSGDEMAYAVLRSRVGTDRPPKELEAMVSDWRRDTLTNIRVLLMLDEELAKKYEENTTGRIADGTPEEYLEILQDEITNDFPSIDEFSYVVLEVHESLQDFLAPAFYLTPAVDSYENQIIYINPASIDDNLTLFTALAHEGYPGHMYQMVYDRQNSLHPIRVLLGNMGHAEGWATYVEILSYSYSGLDAIEAMFMGEMRMYFMLLQAHIDIGVNLFDWDIDTVAELLFNDLGITDKNIIDSYYNAVTGVPLNTIVYALGYIELRLLRRVAEEAEGDSFSAYDFHRAFLDVGPAPFPLIEQRLPWSARELFSKDSKAA